MELAARLEERSYNFAIKVIRFCPELPPTPEGFTVRSQLLRAALGTVGNYRAARRARSRREFVSQLGKTAEEADEASLWARLIVDAGLCDTALAHTVRDEAGQLERIFGKSYGTARENLRRDQIAKSPNRHVAKSPGDQIAKSPGDQIAKSPNRQITK